MRRLLLILPVLAVAGLGAAWILSAPRPAVAQADRASFGEDGDADRGRRIFLAGDCASCHASPGQEDRTRLGGGMALGSPYGVFRTPNISSDPDDGIGRWSSADLANALLSGVSPEGEHYYPVFPYTSYAHMQPGDVKDLMAYLRTLPPVRGKPHEHEIGFPFTVRRAIGLWKTVFLDRSPIPVDPARDDSWNRGHYLVEAVSHCAECHSSRNIAGAIKPKTRCAGGQDPEGLGFAPNITPTTLHDWSEGDVAALLASGRTPGGSYVGSTMADVVHNARQLDPEDRVAIARYVLSLPARPTPEP